MGSTVLLLSHICTLLPFRGMQTARAVTEQKEMAYSREKRVRGRAEKDVASRGHLSLFPAHWGGRGGLLFPFLFPRKRKTVREARHAYLQAAYDLPRISGEILWRYFGIRSPSLFSPAECVDGEGASLPFTIPFLHPPSLPCLQDAPKGPEPCRRETGGNGGRLWAAEEEGEGKGRPPLL